MHTLLQHLGHWTATVQHRYHVDATVFLVLNVVCAPLFYYAIYRTVRAVRNRDRAMLARWSTIFLTVTVVPYGYVMAFGRNLPVWVYVAIAALLVNGVWSLVRRIRGARVPASIDPSRPSVLTARASQLSNGR